MILKPIKHVYSILIYNLKPLILFEVIYRLLGFFVIYPLTRLIFHFSIEVSGFQFITNQSLISFILKPTTLLSLFVLAVIISIYIVIELTFLALLYDLGRKNEHIDFIDFLISGLKRVGKTFIKYNILIIVPSFFFIFIIQAFHIVGIASTINLPDYVIFQIRQMPSFTYILYFLVLLSLIIFVETIFSIHLFTIDRLHFREAYHLSRKILSHQRFKMIREFILVNFIINMILYGIYILVILLIGAIISVTRGQEYVLGFLLTVLYSTYSFIGLLATIILVPTNFALISSWYYDYKEKNGLELTQDLPQKIHIKHNDLKWVIRGTILTIIVLVVLNITTIFSLVLEPRDYVDALQQMDIVAHRGASKDAPENTISSIALAMEQGANIVEFDVQLTQDNVIVLMHDYTLNRTTNIQSNTRLDALNYDQIKDLDAGSWFSDDFIDEKIPTLIEALTFIDGRIHLFIDVKTNSPTMDDLLVSILEQFDYTHKAVVLSTNRNQLVRIKNLNPDIKTLQLISSFYGDINTLSNDIYVDYYGLEQRFVVNASAIIKTLQSRGKKVYAWTVSEVPDMEKVLRYELDGMITARPYVAREVIYSYRTSSSIVDLLTELFSR